MNNDVIMEDLWNWAKQDGLNAGVDKVCIEYHCGVFEQELWFKIGMNTWKKYRSSFQDHMKYIKNIQKPFRVSTIQYYEQFREMNDLSKYPPPPY